MKLKTIPIFLVFFIMGFGDAVGTLVGFVTKEFNLSASLAGLLPFFAFLAYGIFSVPIGILADRKGQKYVLVMFLILVFLGELIPIISISKYIYVIIAIFFIGVGITALQVVGNPMMRDVSAEGKFSRNLTFAQFIKSIGSNTAPYIVPLVVALSFAWTGIFWIYAIVILITIVSVLALKIEKKPDEEHAQKASIKSSFKLLTHPYVALMVFGIFLYVGAEVGLNSWIAKYLEVKFNLDIEKMATLGIGFFLTALAIGRLLGSIILNFLSAKKFFLISALLGVASLALTYVNSELIAIGALFLAGLSFANIFPLIFSILIDTIPERSNELSGLLVMAIVGGAIIPAIMGLFADISIGLSFLIPLLIFVYLTFLAVNSMKRVPAKS